MRKFGVIGKVLTHSFSPKFFNEKFTQESIDAQYGAYELSSLHNFRDFVIENNLNGINVTIPYKEQIIPHLDELSAEAAKIGAVNTIAVKGNKLTGYNTDVIGFKKSLLTLIGDKKLTHALVLGTGGASKAVVFVLQQMGVDIQMVSRNPSNNAISYSQIDREELSQTQLIINTTPLGTFPNVKECPDLPYDLINSSHYCMDLVYNPIDTLFMKKCKSGGSQAINGLGMLHGQALASWDIWNS